MSMDMSGEGTAKEALSRDARVNRRKLEQLFAECADIAIFPWMYGPGLSHPAFCVYCRSLVSDQRNHFMKLSLQDLVSHEVGTGDEVNPETLPRFFEKPGASYQPFVVIDTFEDVERKVWDGWIVLLFHDWPKAVCYQAEQLQRRQVSDPVSEPVVQGSREGTVESLDTNLGLLRKRLKTSRFKVRYFEAGPVMKTRIVYTYVEGTVNPLVLGEFQRRLDSIQPHEVLETAFVEDWIQDSAYSPFPQYRYTERTDAATAALLDGKIVVLVENSPMLLICPALFIDFFSTSEDYYVRTVFATLIRLLRLLAFIIALTLPSVYIALSTFHPELIPTVLLLAILDTREGIPFPAFFEALIMEVTFELLREAGIRLPRPVGSAVSIVGALVIGQAAIMAKIASPIMVIVVALTGIASFAIPHYEFAIALRVLRFPLMIAASLLGGFGILIGFLLTLLHMTTLHTLGEPYLASMAQLKLRDLRDILIRVPLKRMMKSPRNRRLHRQ